ncbi:n-acetylgalactosamine 6-sulfatase : Arylsulfatase A family protein OS=Singulisphaera acidiphila (strain ATCC BAA-1392 / DSM 18658 / VKM B-2454 / MOB10) GN=Sinac_5625 PE=4 SV=1: Sulfatase [Gemmataceae bacterium]|nr:n-acetylgalactosamine 6-sulfatase : Arylsulfatase A family protein OS=Singulisphaera acidiphila (strain ATCC BAA-1392 / DSM 18658 / VKM B-2454 / MOB10) GN=Sinac_5625 PE=4 SV=1: Sulfatase [Gemmataceae bacterium]VTT99788.1 n-acetylgalactosamine 6-sulfatase : Arylsulfatase A family protein OS=Singulisphaera acidiphila (strain ATCC BAA-1392 / DSM 18658 / VKM B-2454 / MOB10) GN=Sinac_5625 PE=4 SV=1: Sulfatase [Gemmataceae bacterium]
MPFPCPTWRTVVAVFAVCLAPISAAAGDRPHVVVVLADDLGPGDLGCWGGTVAETPNIDRLAKEGTRFTRYYAASPICSPSRCGLITGQYPARWKLTSYLQTKAGNRGCGQADHLDPEAPSVARALRAAGYKTAHFGKWHLGGGRDVADAPKFAAYGFDEHVGTWESPEPHPDITAGDWIWSPKDKVKRWERTGFYVDKALDFLARHKDDAPCFVNVWLDDPHTPWVPNARAGKGQETAAALAEVLAENDRQVGRLLAGLKKLGVDRDTLVVFASDNGPLPTLGGKRSGGLRGCKLSLYEGGVRVPLIVRWPGTVPAGAVDTSTVVAAVDLFPTLCAVTGATRPKGVVFDGEDRSAALRGKPAAGRAKPVFWEYGRNEAFFKYPTPGAGAKTTDRSPPVAVLDGDWKLLMNADGSGAELYDLRADAGESKNVAADHTAEAARLTKLAVAWRKSLPD